MTTFDFMVDANVLVYLVDEGSAFHESVRSYLDLLYRSGKNVCIAPQTEVETWAVLTRPRQAGGLGGTPAQASAALMQLESTFEFLPEVSGVHERWKTLVREYGVSGKQVHDARIVAAMNVYGIRRLITKNVADFRRYDEIVTLDPTVII